MILESRQAMTKPLLLAFLCALLLAVLAGCSAATPAPTQTPLPTSTTVPSATPVPSATDTPMPSETPTPVDTATLTPTLPPSLTPTLMAAFDQAQVTGMTNKVGGVQLVVTVPNLTVAYDMILGGNKYSCSVDAKYPGKLFCWGLAQPPFDTTLTIAFLDVQSGSVVFQTKTVLARAAFPTPVPVGYAWDNCPERGTKVSCETECRVEPNGDVCVVSSCFDACGPYFSVDTCPKDLTTWGACDASVTAKMKAKLNIP